MLYNIIQFRRLLDCVNTLSVDKLISLYGSHHINISTYQHINKTHSSIHAISLKRRHLFARYSIVFPFFSVSEREK